MNLPEKMEAIRTFVFDIDGVLTDGMLHVQESGELLRRMNIKDGYALQLAVKKGYHVFVISGGKSTAVRKRLEHLGVTDVFIGVEDKADLLLQLISKHHLLPASVMYMGDDMPDIKVMQIAGVKCCPADAAIEVKKIADYISPFAGGSGCARDMIEKVMKIHDNWE